MSELALVNTDVSERGRASIYKNDGAVVGEVLDAGFLSRGEKQGSFFFLESTAQRMGSYHKPTLTVGKGKTAHSTFNSIAFDEFLKGKGYTHVQIGWDPTNRLIAIKLLKEEMAGKTYKLSKTDTVKSRFKTLRGTFQRLGISTDKTRVFTIRWNNDKKKDFLVFSPEKDFYRHAG